MNYDIIGDIHGHADDLEKLLQKLKYKLVKGVYKHPQNRKVVFLGDFIDRGPKIRETLHIAKNMCDAGNAFAIMGNHEFNAICFNTPNLEKGGFYREHTFKEIQQHYETLKQFQGFEDEWKTFLDWFRKLPLFLELENFNCVHAYWDQTHIDWFNKEYPNFELTNEFLSKFSDDKSKEYNFIEETLKGKEYELPDGEFFHDKDGHKRKDCRLMWWQSENKREFYKDILLLCPVNYGNKKVTETNLFIENSNKPTFFGHYWLNDEPSVKNPNAICLDYSIAKNGKLVAYSFNNEKAVSNKNLSYV